MGFDALLNGTYGNAGQRLDYKIVPVGTSNLEVVISDGISSIAREIVTPARLGGLPVAVNEYPANVIDIRTKLERRDEISPHGLFGYTRRLPTDVQLGIIARCFHDLENTQVLGVKVEDILAQKKPVNLLHEYTKMKEGAEALVRLPVGIHVRYDSGVMAYSVISRDGEIVLEGVMDKAHQFRSLLDYLGTECEIKDVKLEGDMTGKDELILRSTFRKFVKPVSRYNTGASVVQALMRQTRNKVRF